jgi:hypothetical protein
MLAVKALMAQLGASMPLGVVGFGTSRTEGGGGNLGEADQVNINVSVMGRVKS